jgi:predicted nucleic acid-binding protein
MYLLDTNVLSAARRLDKASPGLAAWNARTAAEELYLSSLTIMEIEIGGLRIARKDAKQGRMIRDWLHNDVMLGFEDRIIPFDARIALRCAALQVPDPKATIDAMIAATALEHGLTVVTRNVKHFASMGVKFFNPWTDETV